MIGTNWFSKKWGTEIDYICIDEIYQRLAELEQRVRVLEEENIETTNTLYQIMNSVDAVDRRIDILAERCRIDYDV
jgi:hypothetical protein